MSSLERKNISLYRKTKSPYIVCIPSRPEGRIMIATTRWRGWRWAVVASGAWHQAKRPRRPAKSCGSGAATVASIPAGLCWQGNGDNKRRSPGRARISRKAIALGKSGCLGCTCLIRVRCFPFCTRCCGRSQRPAFPAPFRQERDNELNSSDKNRVARTKRHASTHTAVIAREGGRPSSRWSIGFAQPQPPVFAGCPAFAGMTTQNLEPVDAACATSRPR